MTTFVCIPDERCTKNCGTVAFIGATLLATTFLILQVWQVSEPSPLPPPPLPPHPLPPPSPLGRQDACIVEYDITTLGTNELAFGRGHIPDHTINLEDTAGFVADWVGEMNITSSTSHVGYFYDQTPVKKQGPCGSCWAHAFTEVMEWHFTNLTGVIVPHSRMQVLSCTKYANGCSGSSSFVDVVADFALTRQRLFPDHLYTYDERIFWNPDFARNECIEACRVNVSRIEHGIWVQSFGWATPPCYSECSSQDMPLLEAALQQYGPLLVGVDASKAWERYEGGILPHTACSSNASAGNHVVVLVAASPNYWLIRNSWDAFWGEGGYIRLERDDEKNINTCGVANQAVWLQASLA